MAAYLDIIILLFVVVVVFVKLRGLLGTRPENETEIEAKARPRSFDILMQEHNKNRPQPTMAGGELKADESDLSEQEKLCAAFPVLTATNLSAAPKAFEIIVTSFAKGDIETLETLVGKTCLKIQRSHLQPQGRRHQRRNRLYRF